MSDDGLPAPDPYLQYKIKNLPRYSPYEPLPRPDAVTLEVLRWYLTVLERPEPDPNVSARAFHEYRQVLYLVSDLPDIRELQRWCHSKLGEQLTAAATIAIRKRLSSETLRTWDDIDGLRIADVVTLLGRLPRPTPLPSVGSDGPTGRTEAPNARPPADEPSGTEAAAAPTELRPADRQADGANVNDTLTPAGRALAAAYDLKREGKAVSLRAACDRAGVDRAHLRRKYPEAAAAIGRMATPDRMPRRGVHNRRTGDIDGVDD